MSDSCLVIYNMILTIDKLLHIISFERGNEVFELPHLIVHIQSSEETKFSSHPLDRSYSSEQETKYIK
jgi:hypothetical protein